MGLKGIWPQLPRKAKLVLNINCLRQVCKCKRRLSTSLYVHIAVL